MGSFLLRAALTGFALWVVTLIVPGISFTGGATTLQEVGIIFVVALIFGIVNAIIKPIVQILSIPLYILTLGLFHIVINALMLWLTGEVSDALDLGFHVSGFRAAFVGGLVVTVVSFVLSLLVKPATRTNDD